MRSQRRGPKSRKAASRHRLQALVWSSACWGEHPDGLRTNTVAATATGNWTIHRWGWQFSGTQGLDEAYVPFFGVFGAAWGRRHGRALERQSPWDALAGGECGNRGIRRRERRAAGRGAAVGSHSA